MAPLARPVLRCFLYGLCWLGLLECYYDFDKFDALFMNKSP